MTMKDQAREITTFSKRYNDCSNKSASSCKTLWYILCRTKTNVSVMVERKGKEINHRKRDFSTRNDKTWEFKVK